MKLKNFIWAFVIIGIAGSLGHFVYEWSGNNTVLGYFFPVNESTWEHLKLLFFPTVVFSCIEYFLVKNNVKGYIPSATISLIVGLITIVTIFYTYTGVLGFAIEWFNIAIYYIALILMLGVKLLFILSEALNNKWAVWISIVWIFIMTLMFIIFTYNPLDLGIFKEP